MAKTTAKKTTTHTRRTNTETDLFDMIKRPDSLWRQNKKLDVSPRSPTYEDSMLRQAEVINEACDLERQIAATRVHTKKGFAAKCRAIIEADFSDGDLMMIAVLLGRDAERLRIEESAKIHRVGCFALVQKGGRVASTWSRTCSRRC